MKISKIYIINSIIYKLTRQRERGREREISKKIKYKHL